ncbi:MAG: DUF998 domain-containing protein [Ilumatobacteraceae bacterium]
MGPEPQRDVAPPVAPPGAAIARVAVAAGDRLAAIGGVVGPAAFVGAWVVGAAVTRRDYGPVHDAISRLAEVGADTRTLMTTGFLCFGVGVTLYAGALRRVLEGPAWMTAAATGVATLAVAAAPLGHSPGVDSLHGVVAGFGYLTLAATPLLAARPLIRRGHRTLGRLGVVAGAVSGLALLASVAGGVPTGLSQRVGLTVGDVWIGASALLIASSRLRQAGPIARGGATSCPPGW